MNYTHKCLHAYEGNPPGCWDYILMVNQSPDAVWENCTGNAHVLNYPESTQVPLVFLE